MNPIHHNIRPFLLPEFDLGPAVEEAVQKLYGSFGLATFKELFAALGRHSLTLTFDSSEDLFIVENSANYSRQQLESLIPKKMLDGFNYAWKPTVLDRIDLKGNRLIELTANGKTNYSDPSFIQDLFINEPNDDP